MIYEFRSLLHCRFLLFYGQLFVGNDGDHISVIAILPRDWGLIFTRDNHLLVRRITIIVIIYSPAAKNGKYAFSDSSIEWEEKYRKVMIYVRLMAIICKWQKNGQFMPYHRSVLEFNDTFFDRIHVEST